MNLPHLAHNILRCQIGRDVAGVVIWDENALLTTNSYEPLIELLATVYCTVAETTSLPQSNSLEFYSIALKGELATINETLEFIAYSAQFDVDQWPTAFANSVESPFDWLSKSRYRLYAYVKPNHPSDVEQVIRYVAAEEAAVVVKSILNLASSAKVILLDAAAFGERQSKNELSI